LNEREVKMNKYRLLISNSFDNEIEIYTIEAKDEDEANKILEKEYNLPQKIGENYMLLNEIQWKNLWMIVNNEDRGKQ